MVLLSFRYKWLDRTLPGTTKQIVIKKLLLDQFLMTPQLLVVFYTGMSSTIQMQKYANANDKQEK